MIQAIPSAAPRSPAMTNVVIVSAARTPVGSFNGALSSLPAHELGKVAIKAALDRAHVEPGEVDEVIMGQILTAGEGQTPPPPPPLPAAIPPPAPPPSPTPPSPPAP